MPSLWKTWRGEKLEVGPGEGQSTEILRLRNERYFKRRQRPGSCGFLCRIRRWIPVNRCICPTDSWTSRYHFPGIVLSFKHVFCMILVSTNPTWLPKVLKKWPLGSKIWIRWLYLDKTSLIQSPKEVENFVGHLSAMMNCPILLTATPARQSNSPSPLPYPPNQNLVKYLSNIVDKYHHKQFSQSKAGHGFPKYNHIDLHQTPVLSKLVKYLDSVVGRVSDDHGVVGSHCNTCHKPDNTWEYLKSRLLVVFTSRPCEK